MEILELKNIISEMKKIIGDLSRMEMAEVKKKKVNELEDRSKELIQSE